MNKQSFLRMLEKELSVLEKVEQEEILHFYEERFYTGMTYEGKTEEEIIAELETPQAIAKNVLDEYGVSPRYVKKKEERFANVNIVQIILLLSFDLFIATWLIPVLFTVFGSLFFSSFTWVTTLPLITASNSVVDRYMFALLTGSYVLLFLFSLLVLDISIKTTKQLIVWHLNVFKIKKREHFIKKASHFSVDKFFKSHPMIRLVKNLALIGSILAVSVSGFWVITHFESVKAHYSNDLTIESASHDFTNSIDLNEEWNIEIEVDVYDVEIRTIDDVEMSLVHSYFDKEDYVYRVDQDTQKIYIYDIDEDSIFGNTHLSVFSLFDLFFNSKQEIILYLPEDLVLGTLTLDTSVGSVSVKDMTLDKFEIENSLGLMTIQNIVFESDSSLRSDTGNTNLENIEGSSLGVISSTGNIHASTLTLHTLTLNTDTGRITLENSSGVGAESSLSAFTSTGKIKLENIDYDSYIISSDTGSIDLSAFNLMNKDGQELDVESDTGNISLTNVFVDQVNIESDTGNLYYKNPIDIHFVCSSLEYDTDTGNSNISVISAD